MFHFEDGLFRVFSALNNILHVVAKLLTRTTGQQLIRAVDQSDQSTFFHIVAVAPSGLFMVFFLPVLASLLFLESCQQSTLTE